MAEWLKAHDSKSCGQKCLGGSNPLASAKPKKTRRVLFLWLAREELVVFTRYWRSIIGESFDIIHCFLIGHTGFVFV